MRFLLAVLATVLLSGCASGLSSLGASPPESVPATATEQWLQQLPLPERKVDIALYRFDDRSGQYKPSDAVQSYSRAVSQGADRLLIQALMRAGSGRWFRVLDRSNLESVLSERQVIREARARNKQTDALPPLRYAGVVVAGGIVGYDSNVLSAGGGLRILGIGGSSQVRQDLVTVSLQLVSTQSGEVLHSVVTQKGVYSVLGQGGAFRFIDDYSLLEIEAGAGYNEPGLLALRRAIELAVYQLVVEGSSLNLWAFADQQQARMAYQQYAARMEKPLSTLLVEAVPVPAVPSPTLPAAIPLLPTKPVLPGEAQS